MTQEDFFKRYTYTPSRDRIGGGGFGTVYKAYDNLLHREVALKVSEVKTTADGKKTFSLKDEFEALNRVPKHPNIANYEEFYSFEMPNGIFDYAVMQYYPDGNLSNTIKQGLTAEQKEDIATQLLEGIDFLHKHKVVHRDLKPGNILIVKHGGRIIPLITDFGLSKATGMGENSVFSNSFGAGTPRYSSPEQLQGNPLRFNTDLWSYGAILYELFTGEQLFTAGSGAANTAQADMEVYNKIVNGNVQSLGRMPEKWRKVAERCLVVDATKRAKDAAELLAIIRGDDDETELTERESPLPPYVKREARSDSGVKPNNSILEPRQASPSERGAGGGKTPLEPNDKPTNKKGLWIGLGIAAAVVVALLLLLKPKQEPTPTELDTQAYEACQTVEDYRAYIAVFGQNSKHYGEAMQFVNDFVNDSVAEAKEDIIYEQCTTIAACESYLKAYSQGRYVKEVTEIKDRLEQQAKEEADRKEDATYKKCTTIAGCNAYLKKYPEGRYVEEVKRKKEDLEKAEAEAALEPLPGASKPYRAFTFFFSADSDDISNRPTLNNEADKTLMHYINTYSIMGFEVRGWILPNELDGTAENRANAVANHIKAVIKKSGVVCDYSFKAIDVGMDWNTFFAIIENSGTRDKEAILNQLRKSSDKERTFRELCSIYPQLDREILPSLRRVEVYLY